MKQFVRLSVMLAVLSAVSCSYLDWTREKALQDEVWLDLQKVRAEIIQVIYSLGRGDVAEVQRSPRGVTVIIESGFVFEAGAVNIREELRPLLDALIPIMVGRERSYPIVVEGHTDNVPPGEVTGDRYPTNWEFSALRAARVARYLQDKGVPGGLLTAAGHAATRPYGSSLKEIQEGVFAEEWIRAANANAFLREANRRIEITFEVPRWRF